MRHIPDTTLWHLCSGSSLIRDWSKCDTVGMQWLWETYRQMNSCSLCQMGPPSFLYPADPLGEGVKGHPPTFVKTQKRQPKISRKKLAAGPSPLHQFWGQVMYGTSVDCQITITCVTQLPHAAGPLQCENMLPGGSAPMGNVWVCRP